jgi:putative tricarboxylic transport membrane protein
MFPSADLPCVVGRSLVLGAMAAFLAAGACSSPASSRSYPTSPIDIVVPAPPGGGSDNLARAIQDVIAHERFATQPVTVSNRPGGSGAIGLAYVVSHPDDPHVLVTLTDPFVTLGLQPGYTGPTVRDVKMVAILALDEMAIVVNASSPFKSIQDVIAYAREHPRALKLATEAVGGGDHILGGLIEQATGVSFTYVHTRGGIEALQNVAGGHVELAGPNPSEAIGQIRGGLIRALAVASPERLALFPDVPTLKESGIDVEYRMFRGIAIAPRASADVVRYWEDLLRRVTGTDRWRTQYLERFALTPFFQTGDDARAFVTRLEEVNRATLDHLR